MKPGKVVAVIILWHNDDVIDQMTAQLKGIQYPDFEWVFIDNSDQNRGFAEGLNQGFREAVRRDGEFVLALSPGLLYPSNLVSQLVEVIRPDPRLGAVSARRVHLPERAKEPLYRRTKQGLVPTYWGGCALMRVEMWEEIGGLDPLLANGEEEGDTTIRASRLGWKFSSMANVWVDKPVTRASRNERARSRCQGMWYVQFKHLYLGNSDLKQFVDVLVRAIKNEFFHHWDVGWKYEVAAAFNSWKLARSVWHRPKAGPAHSSEGSH